MGRIRRIEDGFSNVTSLACGDSGLGQRVEEHKAETLWDLIWLLTGKPVNTR